MYEVYFLTYWHNLLYFISQSLNKSLHPCTSSCYYDIFTNSLFGIHIKLTEDILHNFSNSSLIKANDTWSKEYFTRPNLINHQPKLKINFCLHLAAIILNLIAKQWIQISNILINLNKHFLLFIFLLIVPFIKISISIPVLIKQAEIVFLNCIVCFMN